mmetsp:Transcript_85788/g.191811  ORF Transcript_85788/g.191811 Transcript_85788/m.191811 type:complete len:221 (-) Transcript_85788:174-836(-)
MRWVLVMMLGSFLSWGTLKSTRMKIRLSFRSTPSILSLFKSPAGSASDAAAVESSRAATPGRTLPSNNSKEAPPPVLQWDTLSTVSYFLQAVAVSPPPITVTAPASVTSTILSIILLVPASKGAISKTPMGPFQTMVFDFAMAASLSSMDLGPMSRPKKPSGTPLSRSPFTISPSSPNFELQTKSTGRTISTPFFFAFSMISGTSLEPGSSNRDAPISQP